MIVYNPKKTIYLDTDDGVSDLETVTTYVPKFKQPNNDNRILTAESISTISIQNLNINTLQDIFKYIQKTKKEDLPMFNKVLKKINVDYKIDGRTTNGSLVKNIKANPNVKNLLDSIDE